MSSNKESFLSSRIKSVKYASKGFFLLLNSESSIQVQAFIAVVMTILGIACNISGTEWMLQLLAIGLVMGLEGVNTAIEKLSDFVQPSHDDKIGFIKDVSAGAVFIASIAAVGIGLFIYIPRLI